MGTLCEPSPSNPMAPAQEAHIKRCLYQPVIYFLSYFALSHVDHRPDERPTHCTGAVKKSHELFKPRIGACGSTSVDYCNDWEGSVPSTFRRRGR